MVAACMISTVANCDVTVALQDEDETYAMYSHYDPVDGSYEEEAYIRGEYKIILQLVGVLSYGKVAKRVADKAIDAMADVQNLRKAIFEYVSTLVFMEIWSNLVRLATSSRLMQAKPGPTNRRSLWILA